MRRILAGGFALALFASAASAQTLPVVPCTQGVCQADPTTSAGPFPTGISGRVITKTAVVANTSTQVCPASSKLTAQTIQVQTGGGLGLSNETLTSGTYATGAGSPDVVLVANAQYVSITPPTNATTFYGAAQVVICVQEGRP